MAKVRVKGVNELAAKLNRNLRIELNKLFRDADLRRKIGSIIAEDIKDNVNFGAPSAATDEWRGRYEPYNTTDPKYDRSKLNATFTGELLADLASNVKAIPSELTFLVEHSKKKHKRYSGPNGKIGKSVLYSKISSYLVNDLNYDYFKLSDRGQKLITDEIRKVFFKLLSKY